MAVAFDAITTHAGDDNDFTHTPVGTPTLVLVTAHRNPADTTGEITGVTYDGQALARHAFIDASGNTTPKQTSDNPASEVWFLHSPNAGAVTVAITLAGTDDNSESYSAVTFTGTATSNALGTIDTANWDSNVSNSVSGTVTSDSDGMCLDVLTTEEAENHTVDSGQTERADESDGANQHRMCVSTEPGASSVTMGWSWTTNTRVAYIVVPISAPAPGSPEAPAAPTATTGTVVGDTIVASFTPGDASAQHRAYIKRTTDSVWTWSGDLAVGETSFTHEWLVQDTAYDVGFTAFDLDAESAMSKDLATQTEIVRLVSGSFL